ncbi:hypothetical protein SAMD00019534_109830 [Acytostelium subglobosum LB1]|uniref:hypothetical protein n=1 Tax=Acytostelium subglobosum LB1 TaxID=1410327 RepID=UPI000644D73D|nr:hypothetical protein SAMD00019534_109830 [Acytostelium subglobosum LB1]GAM27807.1 hypothetical protein SAMD00019534_109830 [Acytostelium subglobosum LB1]|eukprot:XP_012749090.1 hypothetical protein SAMD00019534_109830 [Acytostelium subglobosum LB1]
MNIFILFITICILTTPSVVQSATCGLDQSYHTAIATWYPGDYQGACGFGPLFGSTGPHTPYITALSASWFDASTQCGVCFELTSPYTNKTITVVATDNCPDCPEEHHFDLSKDAFAQMADPSLGRLNNITWRQVACGNIGSLGISLVKGSNQYWVGYVIYNSYVGISKVEEQLNGTTEWVNVPRAPYNYFESKVNHKDQPYNVRITSILGEQITYQVQKAEPSNLLVKSQFSADGCAAGKLLIMASGANHSITVQIIPLIGLIITCTMMLL